MPELNLSPFLRILGTGVQWTLLWVTQFPRKERKTVSQLLGVLLEYGPQ